MMKIIVDMGKRGSFTKINDDIYLCTLNKFLYKIGAYKLRKKFIDKATFYATENIKNKKVNLPFYKESIENIFLFNLEKIVKTLITENNTKFYIISESEDERIFEVIKAIKNWANIIFISTDNEYFFDEVCEYNMKKYGIATNKKNICEIKKDGILIILNCQNYDFNKRSEYIINLSENEIYGLKVLYDIIPQNNGDFSHLNIKKCQFLSENTENFNLIWRNSQKSVDKSEI